MIFKAKCERIRHRQNNGITEFFFVRHSHFSNEPVRDERAIFNLHASPDEFEMGKEYIWESKPAS